MNASRPLVYHVSQEQVQKSLVQGLRDWMSGESWSALRKLLAENRVQVNGNLCRDEGRRLKANDVVRVMPVAQSAPPTAASIKIRYLDADVVVVEKPAGMTTLRHVEERNWPERRKQLQPTLEESIPRAIELSLSEKRERPATGKLLSRKNRREGSGDESGRCIGWTGRRAG
jgi:23S rRNA pseudouridine1911/1915/1917 synthase